MKQNGIRILALILAGIMSLSAFSCAKEEMPSGNPGNSTLAKTDGPANPDGPAETPDATDPGDASEEAFEEAAAPAETTEPEWPEPDYSDFELPEDTGKLVVYVESTMGKAVMDPAIIRFRELYPSVEVDYTIMGVDEYAARVQAELPVGRGPDLFLFRSTEIPDIFKTMETEIFADLNPWFAADPEIDPSEFVAGAMKGGRSRGRQYIVPICFDAPILVARRSVLDALGIEDPSDFASMSEAARKFKEIYPKGTLFMDNGGLNPYVTDMVFLAQFSGLRCIDYQRSAADCDEELAREVMDLMKLYYIPDYVEYEESKKDRLVTTYMDYECLLRNDCLFNHWDTSFDRFYSVCKELNEAGDEAVAFVPRDAKGNTTADIVQMAAIPQGSQNKLNAWRLLKVLLSDEIQTARDKARLDNSIFWSGMPVRLSSLRSVLEFETGFWGYDLNDPEVKIIFDRFVELWSSPTDARVLPVIIRRYINLELMPYVRGEKSWDDCYKRFLNTLELYASE